MSTVRIKGQEVKTGDDQVQKYCSNECSAKHNRTKQHIVVEDAMVLDSPYEALFYGLLRLCKIPVERADREQAVEVNGNGWYCPDFWLPEQELWVEVKGFEDDDDRARYEAWRSVGRELAVLDRNTLVELCAAGPRYVAAKLVLLTDRQRRQAAADALPGWERQARIYSSS